MSTPNLDAVASADLNSLTSPIRIGKRRSVNRVAMAPMTNKQSLEDGMLDAAEIEWLGLRADGGFGVVITGGWAVTPDGRIWHGQAALYAERHVPPLTALAGRIAPTSALGIVQLIHGGSRASHEITRTAGVSAYGGDGYTAATVADIRRFIEAHRIAATRVQDAGLHGIEVHSAHGFLPAQFISATDNRRTDGWGGDLPGRARFLRELVRTIRATTGDDFVVGVRLSPENARHGILLEETAQIATWLADEGMDYLHLSLGDARAGSREDDARGSLEVVREAVPVAVPIIAAGGVRTPEDAVGVLRRGADLVALGTAAIHDPAWPQHAIEPDRLPDAPPSNPRRLAAVGVTPPFLQYLREGWPETIADTREGIRP